jgi:hypothetical protein
MADRQDIGAASGVNPVTLSDILQFDEASLRVTPRPDLDAIEVKGRARGRPPVVLLLAPVQGLALAERLVGAVVALAREGRP